MLNYATIGSNRLDEAKAYYDALLGSIGMKPFFEHPSGGRIYGQFGKSAFGVLGAFDGGEASVGNGVTISFEVPDADALATFHAKALALGGTDEGAPGPRGGDKSPFHFAYFRDLDGNKLCGYCVVK